MTDKKRFTWKVPYITASAIVLSALLIPFIIILSSSTDVIIKDRNETYSRGKKLLLLGDTLACLKGDDEQKDKSALSEPGRTVYSFKILSMKNINSIEISEQMQPSVDTETGEAPDAKYLGKYKIRLQGHEGILRLRMDKEKITGTVRFPAWGKGAVEYLKAVKIAGGRISFTRSANTYAEMNRLGANSYFTQKFSGAYSSSGSKIDGFFINDRKEKHQWDAEK